MNTYLQLRGMARSGTRHSSHSQSRNCFAVATSVGSKLRRGAIRATQDRDSCAVAHRRYILLSSPYIQSIPNFLQWVKIGWNILKLLISIDIYWYLLISIDVQIWRSPPIGGLFWQQIGSFCIMSSWHEQEARWKAAVCPEIELFLHLACKSPEILGIRDFTNRNAEKQYSIKQIKHHHQTHFDLD